MDDYWGIVGCGQKVGAPLALSPVAQNPSFYDANQSSRETCFVSAIWCDNSTTLFAIVIHLTARWTESGQESDEGVVWGVNEFRGE